MMNWFYYLLEANLYLAAFYLMYKLLLQGTTFYNANRYFLISSIVAAFVIPLLQLGFLKPQVFAAAELDYYEIPLETLEIKTIENLSVLTIEDYLVYVYIAFAACLAIQFLISIAKIVKMYFGNKKQKSGKYTLVELPTEQSAFSFFNVLFIHPSMAKNDAILTHEKIHIKEKHSLDIVLLELLKIICWFNPIVYFIKNDLKLLHEYIADENTTAATISKHEYAMFLIENSIGAFSPSLVNQFFNQSILKSRINMLNKEKTANWARLKYLLAVPLGVGLLCASTLGFSKSYGYVDLFPEKLALQEPEKEVNDEVKMAKNKRYSPSYVFDKDNNYKSLEKRLIVINGVAIKDNNKYYGSNNADKIFFLNAKEATNKYGAKGKYGAVEIYGKQSVLTYQPPYVIADTAKFPAPKMQASGTSPVQPKVKKDQIKYPPSYRPRNQSSFYPRNAFRDEKIIAIDKRLILINGEAVKDNGNFYGVVNTEEVVVLNAKEAVKKYGEKGANGAVEVSGSNIKMSHLTSPPPSLYPKKQKKLPPPIVKPDKKTSSANSAKLVEEIELAQLALTKNEKPKVIEVVPTTQKVQGIQLSDAKASKVNSINQEVVVTGYPTKNVKVVQGHKIEAKPTSNNNENIKEVVVTGYPTKNVKVVEGHKIETKPTSNSNKKTTEVNQSRLELKPADKIERLEIKPSARPSKKVQKIKLTPSISQNQTGALKTGVSQSTNKQKVSTPKVVIEKTDNVFTKAWSIYKPQVGNKGDNC